MASISKRRKEGSKSKGMGDHNEFLKRITKTLYYAQLPKLPVLSLPLTEISCEAWSAAQRGRSLRRLHADAAARLARGACVSPCALVLALLYLERLRDCNPAYLAAASPSDLFLVSLMVGNKFLQDDGEDDEVLCSEWATSGGLELNQLKKLEVQFLDAIGWNVFVSDECFEAGLRRLERRVALREARRRGFFTYGDLAAAGGGGGGGALAYAALGLALAAAAAAAAVLAALALRHALITGPVDPAPEPASASPAPAPAAPATNSTLTPDASITVSCPSAFYLPSPPPTANPEEPTSWWTRPWLPFLSTTVLQRWLERRATVARHRNCFKLDGNRMLCDRQWVNLSKLNYWTSVSDR